MYLEHFGLDSPPFTITPTTGFFFSGASRGEILDALIYAITESEGVIKVTGEVGSGKTMLCRMLLERLPRHVEAIYLANPSLSRDELLYAIADGLGLNLGEQRITIIMQALQNLLARKVAEGKRVVVLVDEAHAMPLDTLEELRLLYNLQAGNQKLLHIVLFGQPELNGKLDQPSMRQLKDRIVHHFVVAPLSMQAIESYLMFRMRTAGYRGPTPFSPPAINLIGAATQGLMRRTNILADKALLAAFVEGVHSVNEHHVQAAIRDTELPLPRNAWNSKKISAITAALFAASIVLISLGWIPGKTNKSAEEKRGAASEAAAEHTPAKTPAAPPVQTVPTIEAVAAASGVAVAAAPPSPAAKPDVVEPARANMEAKPEPSLALLHERLAATKQMLAGAGKGATSIQLYYTTAPGAQKERVERFLARASGLGRLSEIYVLPIEINGSPGYRILYGVYPDTEAAQAGMEQLPQRFKEAFNLSLYLIGSGQTEDRQPTD